MIDDKIKSNNISQHFNNFDEYLLCEIKAVVGGFVPTFYIKNNQLFSDRDKIIDGVYLKELSADLESKLFKPFTDEDVILNNSESYGSLGIPCHIEDYKIVKNKDLIYGDKLLQNKKDKSFYARIYPYYEHKCLADLIKNFYQYVYVEDTGYVWTDNKIIHKKQFLYERLKVNFHEICGDSYSILKSIMKTLCEIKENGIENSAELLILEDMLTKVIISEKELLK